MELKGKIGIIESGLNLKSMGFIESNQDIYKITLIRVLFGLSLRNSI